MCGKDRGWILEARYQFVLSPHSLFNQPLPSEIIRFCRVCSPSLTGLNYSLGPNSVKWSSLHSRDSNNTDYIPIGRVAAFVLRFVTRSTQATTRDTYSPCAYGLPIRLPAKLINVLALIFAGLLFIKAKGGRYSAGNPPSIVENHIS